MFKRLCFSFCLGLMLAIIVACTTPPTPTPLPLPTPLPTNTPTLVPTATVTPIPTNTSTPTVTPTITNTPRPTLTPTPSTETYVLFTDNFDGACSFQVEENAEHAHKCESGEYYILNKVANKSWTGWHTATLDDFIIEFDARFVSGPGNVEYGMWFRSTSDKAYLLSLYSQGGYGFGISIGSDWKGLLDPIPSDAVKKGDEKNRVKIIAREIKLPSTPMINSWTQSATARLPADALVFSCGARNQTSKSLSTI